MPNYTDDGTPAVEEIEAIISTILYEWEDDSTEQYDEAARRIVLFILQHPKVQQAINEISLDVK